jgi:rubrerythrin
MPAVFRCRICGEVYFGNHPTHCPFCVAHAEYLVALGVWKDENAGIELTETDRKNLEETRELEYINTRFYRAAAAATESTAIQGYFKYLAKIENEHYNVACKLLGAEKDATIFDPSEGKGSDMANLEHSKEREEHASKLYETFIPISGSERVKTFFKALSVVEADHIELDAKEIEEIKEKAH